MVRGERVGGWRKISAATWGSPQDPQVYGDLEIEATALLAYADRVAETSGRRPTMTHLMARGVAHAMAVNPDLNVRLHRGRVVQRDDVDIFLIASTAGGDDLSGVLVRNADRKDVAAIAAEVADRAKRLQAGEDDLATAKRILERLPRPVLRALLAVMAWLAIDLDHDVPAAGVQRQTFGSALISSVGMFGITKGYAPLSAFYRVPFLVLVGQVEDRPVVRDGAVVARPMVTVTATLDHRYVDGFHAARLARSLADFCGDPAAHDAPAAVPAGLQTAQPAAVHPAQPPTPPDDDTGSRTA